MTEYKIVKIWYCNTNGKNEANEFTKHNKPDFSSINSNFKVGKDQIKKGS